MLSFSPKANNEPHREFSEGASEHLISDKDDNIFFGPSGWNSATQGADCENLGTQSRGMELNSSMPRDFYNVK